MSMYPPEMFDAIEDDTEEAPIPSQLDAEPQQTQTLKQVVREQIAECLYELAEFLVKPDVAGGSHLLTPITAERKQFTELEDFIWLWSSKFGNNEVKPFEKGSVAPKVLKMKRIKIQYLLQQLAELGKAECMDADGLRTTWRLK